ncbi:unnamed protein product [Bursaphelenchus xylophilus]|uniref:(pine wood nematode) hypothetical protein n=1 Tax=Bursaphelenchus xylophilus TaxID=6326 RepID=A0A7I8X6T1_BURXY|nr:unnamed protein product [Bursaphelenchus xylophilus]CAG9123690.1 unnamed protein product [Bursaphelenchus xylophilus]
MTVNNVFSERQISLVTPLEDIAVPEGADAIFTCTFEQCPPNSFIFWSKDGQRFSTVGNKKYISNLEDGVATLNITSVQSDDSGLYKCEVEDKENKCWSEAALTVTKQTNQPELSDIKIGEDAQKDSKQTSPKGTKPKKVLKKKSAKPAQSERDGQVDSESSKESPEESEKEDQQAKLDQNEKSEQKVKHAAKILEDLENVEVNSEEELVLKVATTPEEWTEVKWLHNGVRIRNTDKYSLEERKDTLALKIKNCSHEDKGEWRLIIKTGTSSLETSCFVDVNVEENTPPSFTTELEDQSYVSGCMVMLKTIVRGKPTPKITWYKDSEKLSNSGDYRIVDNINSHMLTILETTTSNAGEYECVAKNVNGKAVTKSKITITDKKAIKENEDETQAPIVRLPLLPVRELPEASEINLVCTVTGIPPPKIEWFKDDELVTFANFKYDNGIATLNIPEAKLSHSGIYTCVAKNRFGTVRSSGVLYIQPKPNDAQRAPKFEELLYNSTIEKGRELSLVCKASGKPQPTITWFKDGLKIIANHRLVQYTDRRGVVRLNIINVNDGDAGEYSCEAENGYGRDFTHCSVKVVTDKEVSEKPAITSQAPKLTRSLVDSNVHEGNRIIFECEFDSAETPKVQWYHNKELIEDEKALRTYFDGRLAILKVFEASQSHAGVYECIASNKYGEVKSTAKLNVERTNGSEEYPPNMPEFDVPIKDTTVMEGEDALFTCKVKGALNPTVQWLFNGSAVVESMLISASSNDETHSLTIKNVTVANAGVYTAIAKNIYGDIHSSAELKVTKDETESLVAPTFLHPLHDKTAIFGENVSLKCSIDAVPTPSVIWEKDGKVVQASKRLKLVQANNVYALKLYDVTMSDAGNYMITITNPKGSATSECALMIATESGADSHLVAGESDTNKPEFIVRPPEEASVSEGTPIELHARVNAYPTATVKWLKDGKEIARTNRSYHTRVSGDGEYVLLIECAILKTAGLFSCLAVNKHGQVQSDTRLKVKKRTSFKSTGNEQSPIFTAELKETAVKIGMSASFNCQVTGNPEPTVSWIFIDNHGNKQILESGKNGWKSVKNGGIYEIRTDAAVKTQEGTYQCTARNKEGSSVTSAKLIVSDGEGEIGAPRIIEPLKDINVAVGGKSCFRIQIVGTPQSIEWSHSGKKIAEDHRRQIRQPKPFFYELLIYPTKVSDVGSYSVKVTSSHGEVYSEAILNVMPGLNPPSPQPMKSPLKSPLSPLFQLMSEREEMKEPRLNVKRKGAAPDFVVGLQDIEVAAGDVAAVAGKLQPRKRRHKLFEKRNQDDPKALTGSLVARLSNENEEQTDYTPQHQRPNTTLAEIGKTIALRNKEPCAPKFFVKPKPKTEIEEAKSLRLKAAISGNPIPDVRWDKNGVILETGNKFSIYNDGDLYFLEVHQLSSFDQGFYNCTATNHNGLATFTTQLIVIPSDESPVSDLKKRLKKQPVPVSFIEVLPGRQKANVGEEFTMECSVAGYPAPSITWQRNGTTLVPQRNKCQMFFDGESATIRFVSLSPTDEGTIVCVAENPSGKIQTQTYLEVTRPDDLNTNVPKFRETKASYQKVVDGTPLTIETALLQGVDPITFKWLHENVTLEDGHGFKYGRNKEKITLTIADPFPEDSGEYLCVAENAHGLATRKVQVTIRDTIKSPLVQKHPVLNALTPVIHGTPGSSVELVAESSGSEAVISWYHKEKQLLASEKHEMFNVTNKHTMRLHELEKYDEGIYKLLAMNNVGLAEAEFIVNLQDNVKSRAGKSPNFTRKLPSSISCSIGDTATVSCEFEGDPIPKVCWFKGSKLLQQKDNLYIETTPTSTQLSVYLEDKSSQGEYLCTLRNPFGEDLSSFKIILNFLHMCVVRTMYTNGNLYVQKNILNPCLA